MLLLYLFNNDMATSQVKYIGDLRTESTHLQSGKQIITDAPVDNHGKGEAFSPTDLLATSLANCMLTVMGIAAKQHEMNIDNTIAEVTKIMLAEPRKVGEIIIKIQFPAENYSEKNKKILERAALTCPVYYSLHPDLKKTVEFLY